MFLRTTEASGTCFIRTDQLDGETDWKLRLAVPVTQKLETNEELFSMDATVYAEKPQKDIHNFIGTFTKVLLHPPPPSHLSVHLLIILPLFIYD